MSEIDKIQRYISKTGINEANIVRYDIHMNEWRALCRITSITEAIAIAFDYGRARGYRAAKAEARRA